MKAALTASLAFGLLVSASAGHAGQVAGQGAVIAAEAGHFATVDRRAQIAPSPQFDHLKTLARRAGRVRVIVGLRVAFTPEGTLSPAASKAQHQAIASATAAVRQALSGTDHRVIHTYEFVPLIALELSNGALIRLQNSDLAATLWKDTPKPPPTLAQGTNMKEAKVGGPGIAVAILDTGVDRTPRSLRRVKVISEACFSDGDCPNGGNQQFGRGAAGRGVAGTGANIDGVAPGADIIAIQVFSHFTGTRCRNAADDPCTLSFESDQIAGLDHVFRLRNTFTIGRARLSLGSGLFSLTCNGNPLKLAIDNLRSVRIPTVIGSGDDGLSNATNAPGCISTAMTVGAKDKSDAAAAANLKHTGSRALAPPDLIVTGGEFGILSGGKFSTRLGGPRAFNWRHTTKNTKVAGQETAAAPESQTGIKFENAQTSVVVDLLPVPELRPGNDSSDRARFRVNFKTFDYGTYDIAICADSGTPAAVTERDENNNCLDDLGPFYVIPLFLKGRITGTWKTIEGATVSWEGTMTFHVEFPIADTGVFYYLVVDRPDDSLKFKLAGTTGDCTWSGRATYRQGVSDDDNIRLEFGRRHRYFAQILIREGFRIPGRITCPDPDGGTISVPAPIDVGGEFWLNTGRWRTFQDPCLTRLKGEFADALTTFTWDLEALDSEP